MARITATPEPYLVFNEFDRHGILLDLPRIDGERNWEYKQRLLDVFVNRSNSTYRGLINGITRELGLELKDTLSVIPVIDSNGDPLLPNPAVEFIDTKCILYRDYMDDDILLTMDRFLVDDGVYTIGELRNTINSTGYFVATLLDTTLENKRSMTLFNQSSIVDIIQEEISGSGSTIVLRNNNLLEGTVTVRSENLTRLVATEAELTTNGSYTVLLKEGVVVAKAVPEAGSFIRYAYRDDKFVAQSSPVIIHNLQSNNFRNHMFENTGENNEDNYGLPTRLGADLINELMTVFPANWGQ